MGSSHRTIGLRKTVENVGEELFADARASVGNGEFHAGTVSPKFNSHLAVSRCKTNRVGKQIPDNLLKALKVSGNRGCARLQKHSDADSLRVRGRTKRFHRS